MTPLISIIVPVYKVETTLHYCIESILQQTYKNFEVILIDDGSPDKSGEICDKYAEKDIRIKVIHKENGGVSSARNTGFDNAKGEYIVCVDSDDYVNENYLQDFIDVLNQYPDVQMVLCGYSSVKDYNKSVIITFKYDCESNDKMIITDKSNVMSIYERFLFAAPWNKLYSKEIIKSNKLYMDKTISLGEDLLFNFSYIDKCSNDKIYILNKSNYNYVEANNESLNSRFYPDMFKLYRYINSVMFNHLNKWKVSDLQMEKYYNSAYFNYITCMKNTFRSKNTFSSNKERYKYNKKILQSEEFRTVLKGTNCKLVPFIKIIYKTNSYWLVEKYMNVVKFVSDLRHRR